MSAGDADTLIVVPCLNEAKWLPALLHQLMEETEAATVVVADGGSTDGSWEIAQSIAQNCPRFHLIANPARIQSSGINLAVKKFQDQARWLVRMDVHCEYPDNYIRGLREAADASGGDAVVVPMVSCGTGCFQLAAATAQNSRFGTGGSAHRHIGKPGWVDHGHHALMDLRLFSRLGGYREDMPHNEDAELDARICEAGGRIWMEPALSIKYFPRSSARALWRQYRNYGAGRAKTILLHRSKPRLRQVVPVGVPIAAGLSCFVTVNPWLILPMLTWATASMAAGVVAGIARRSRCAFFSGFPAMVMHMAWGIGFLRGIWAGRNLLGAAQFEPAQLRT